MRQKTKGRSKHKSYDLEAEVAEINCFWHITDRLKVVQAVLNGSELRSGLRSPIKSSLTFLAKTAVQSDLIIHFI